MKYAPQPMALQPCLLSGRSCLFQETAGRHLYDLGNRQWDIPRLRELLETVLPRDTKFENVEVEHDFPAIGPRRVMLNARRIAGKKGKTQLILLAMEDVTGRDRGEGKIA